MGHDADMTAIILTWNLDKWNDWEPAYDEATALTSTQRPVQARWSVARRRNIQIGTDAYLLLQGRIRGLVGHGTVISSPFTDAHYALPGRVTNYVDVRWDRLLPIEDRLLISDLQADVPDFDWRHVLSSGWTVPPSAEPQLQRLWSAL